MDLVELTRSLWLRARSPKTFSMALDSSASPSGVRGGVGVDVVDLVGRDAGDLEGGVHGAEAAFAFGGHAGHVEGVGGHAVADDFGEDLCAAGFGELELFEDEDAGAFADDEAVAVLVEGAAGVGGVVVAGGESLHGGEACRRRGG